jgi:predicted nucleic acid-binding protein
MPISTSEKIGLIDTNVLVYRADQDSTFHLPSVNLISRGLRGDISLCLAPQNLTEFYAVMTNPKRVTNPIDPVAARVEIERYLQSQNIRKIYQTADLIPKLLELINQYPPTRQQIFDLQLIATMLVNDITRIYTFNAKHFQPYQEIEVIVPE